MSIFALRDLRPREIFFIELSLIGGAILVAWIVVKSVIRYRKLSRFPLINGKRSLEFTWTPAKKRVHRNAKELIQYGFTKVCTFIESSSNEGGNNRAAANLA
jgi:hypothetical protein